MNQKAKLFLGIIVAVGVVLVVVVGVRVLGHKNNNNETEEETEYQNVSKKLVTVSFNTNGGSKIDDIEIEAYEKIKQPITTREGYDFVGWYLDGEVFDFNTSISENITLEARWVVTKTNKEEITISSAVPISNRISNSVSANSKPSSNTGGSKIPTKPDNNVVYGELLPVKNLVIDSTGLVTWNDQNNNQNVKDFLLELWEGDLKIDQVEVSKSISKYNFNSVIMNRMKQKEVATFKVVARVISGSANYLNSSEADAYVDTIASPVTSVSTVPEIISLDEPVVGTVTTDPGDEEGTMVYFEFSLEDPSDKDYITIEFEVTPGVFQKLPFDEEGKFKFGGSNGFPLTAGGNNTFRISATKEKTYRYVTRIYEVGTNRLVNVKTDEVTVTE